MASLDYECDNGHLFTASRGRDREKCPQCGLRAPIIWISPRSPHRQLKEPIVMWKYADGTLGVAGGSDSRTPPNAERLEIRSVGEYRRLARTLNSQLRGKESQREERFMQMREAMQKQSRSNLSTLMANETDPAARDIYREALERSGKNNSKADFREFFSMAMEMDKSNYE